MFSTSDELLLPREPADPEESSAPAKTRMRDGTSARSISGQLEDDDRIPSHRRRLTKAMIDGAKPFPLDNSGMCNLNFLDGKAIMQQSGVPYYAIFNDVGCYVEAKTTFQPENPDSMLWGDQIARRFHEMLWRWDGFDWNMQQASYWMRLHGTGPIYFDDHSTWKFRSLESGMMQVSAGSASCVDERLPYIKVKVAYRVHELYDFIKDDADNQGYTNAGWNVPAVMRAIRDGCRKQGWANEGRAPWSAFQSQFDTNGLLISTTVDFIACVHFLVREFNGKISKFVITNDDIPLGEGDQKDDQFLFRSLDCYEAYGDCVVVFFKDIGDGTWASVRGYASDAFDSLVVMNQSTCQMVDAARVDASILLEFESVAQRDKFDKFQIRRGINKLPVGAKVVQARVQGAIQGAMDVNQLLSTKLNNNIGNFQGRGMSREDGKGETVTAAEVRSRVAKESSLDQGDMTLFFGYLDHVYAAMFKRAVDPSTSDEEAKRFQAECVADGVPKGALQGCEVRANRESGYGSPEMRELKLQQLREIAPSLPTEGQQNLLDMQISAIAGPDKVKFLNPRQHVPDLNDKQAWEENQIIRNGASEPPPIVSGEDPIIHLHSHLADAADYLGPLQQALEQGQKDPDQLEKAYRYTQIMAAHCQQHLAQLLNDPVREKDGKVFQDDLAHIVSFTGKLRGALIAARKEAQLAAEQQGQATALSALDQAKVQSVQTHAQLSVVKAQSSIADKSAKTLNDIKLNQLKTAAEIASKRQRAVVMPPKKKAA